MSRVARVAVAMVCCFACVARPAWAVPPPQVSVSPALPTGWLAGGSYVVKVAATSSIGIETLTVALPTIERLKPLMPSCLIANTSCIDPSLDVKVLPAMLREGRGDLVITAIDADFQTTKVQIPLPVDRAAPAAISDLVVDGAQGWRAENRFDVSWAVPPADAGSPVVAARYELCPMTRVGDCLTGRREGARVTGLDDLAVPSSGVWQLRVALEDEAGHADLSTAPMTTLRLDAEPPTLAFVLSPENPAKITADAADAGAGLAGVAIEVRRRGENAWRALAVEGNGPFTAVLNDDMLPAGTYEVRLRAVDAVGNERSVAAWSGSEAVEVALPVRQGSKIIAGVATAGTKSNAATKLQSRPVVAFGKATKVRGTVTDDLGHVRAAVPVKVSERLVTPGASWRELATVVTDHAGGFSFRAIGGPARTLRFDYAGSPVARAASAEVTLRVQARTTLTANRRHLRNGDTVVLRGKLSGESIPEPGKLLTLQARVPSGWRTFGTTRARAKDGRWSYRYRFTGTHTTARYTFRVVVPQEAAFPYVTGTSRRLGVVVSGSR